MKQLLIQGLDGEGPGDIVGAITGDESTEGRSLGDRLRDVV